jgi:hypothetical protein
VSLIWADLVLAIEHLDTVFNGALHFKMHAGRTGWLSPREPAQSVADRFEAFLSQPRR